MTEPGSVARASRSKNLALVAMMFAVAMTFIDQTIVAIASPNIQSELSLSRGGTQWVVNAYLLALAATFALGGRLADVLGRRRMVLIGLGIAVLGTALTTVLTHRLTTSFTGLGLPASAAEAAADGSVGQASGGVPASVPGRLREAIQAAVATDFAVATRAVLIGMAIAMGASFLVALAHPGRSAPTEPTGSAAQAAAEKPAA